MEITCWCLTFPSELPFLLAEAGTGRGALPGALVLALPTHQHVSQSLQRLERRPGSVISRMDRAYACTRVHGTRFALDRAAVPERIARSRVDARDFTRSPRITAANITNAGDAYRFFFSFAALRTIHGKIVDPRSIIVRSPTSRTARRDLTGRNGGVGIKIL